MCQALELAAKGLGRTSPNPCVGAVLVKGGRLIGTGWHRKAGSPHAEVLAIRDARRRGHATRGATLFVTLEPCCTHGRTPPCTDAIQEAGIARVVVAATDPNPAHAGRAYRLLRRAGIQVATGVLAAESSHLNRAFHHWITTGQPWVIAKAAFSLDGKMTRPDGERWLTSAATRRDVHRLRAQVDAILVGAGTARADNPALTVRGVRGTPPQPWRVVVTRSGRLPDTLQLFHDAHKNRTLVFQRKSWPHILADLGKRGITSLLVEGGGAVLNDLARKNLVNEVVCYYAPLHFGGDRRLVHADALRALPLRNALLEQLGPDLKLVGMVDHVPA